MYVSLHCTTQLCNIKYSLCVKYTQLPNGDYSMKKKLHEYYYSGNSICVHVKRIYREKSLHHVTICSKCGLIHGYDHDQTHIWPFTPYKVLSFFMETLILWCRVHHKRQKLLNSIIKRLLARILKVSARIWMERNGDREW